MFLLICGVGGGCGLPPEKIVRFKRVNPPHSFSSLFPLLLLVALLSFFFFDSWSTSRKNICSTAIRAGSTICQCHGYAMRYRAGLPHEPVDFLETSVGTYGRQADAGFKRKNSRGSSFLLVSLHLTSRFPSPLCFIAQHRKLEALGSGTAKAVAGTDVKRVLLLE